MTCTLLPGLFGVFIQGLLFAVSVSVLVLKKRREDRDKRIKEPRDWPTFLLDSSKQFFGAGWIHVANMMCASVLGTALEGNGCEWYWVNIMVDTTLGVGIEYVILSCLTEVFESLTNRQGIFSSGVYKNERGQVVPTRYIAQLGVWLLCVTFMKFAVVVLMLAFQDQFQAAAHGFLGIFPASSNVQLVVVMLITPCCMNAFQFWLTDSFIKKHEHEGELSMPETGREVGGQSPLRRLTRSADPEALESPMHKSTGRSPLNRVAKSPMKAGATF